MRKIAFLRQKITQFALFPPQYFYFGHIENKKQEEKIPSCLKFLGMGTGAKIGNYVFKTSVCLFQIKAVEPSFDLACNLIKNLLCCLVSH